MTRKDGQNQPPANLADPKPYHAWAIVESKGTPTAEKAFFYAGCQLIQVRVRPLHGLSRVVCGTNGKL